MNDKILLICAMGFLGAVEKLDLKRKGILNAAYFRSLASEMISFLALCAFSLAAYFFIVVKALALKSSAEPQTALLILFFAFQFLFKRGSGFFIRLGTICFFLIAQSDFGTISTLRDLVLLTAGMTLFQILFEGFHYRLLFSSPFRWASGAPLLLLAASLIALLFAAL